MSDFQERLDAMAPPEGAVALFWLEQSHFLFKMGDGRVIHVDPFLSRDVKPQNHIYAEPVVAADQVQADFVFLTHNHRDHTDKYTLGPMAKANPGCQFFAPAEAAQTCREAGIEDYRLTVTKEGEGMDLEGFRVDAVHSQNTSAEDATTHLGYVFHFGPLSAYHTGDTRNHPEGYIDSLGAVENLQPTVMMVPINELHNNPGPAGAAELVRIVNPQMVIPCHYDCFIHNTVDPARFVAALPAERRGQVRIMNRGEGFILDTNPL